MSEVISAGLVAALQVLLFPGFVFIIFLAFFYQWIDRKVVARLQNRYGPLHTGPSGILQPLADFVKLLATEDIEPTGADKLLFMVTPVLMPVLPLVALFSIPIVARAASFPLREICSGSYS